jgi:hypothetical protein
MFPPRQVLDYRARFSVGAEVMFGVEAQLLQVGELRQKIGRCLDRPGLSLGLRFARGERGVIELYVLGVCPFRLRVAGSSK